MFEDILELVIGPVGIVALAIVGATKTEKGKTLLRSLTKETVRAGLSLRDKGADLLEQVKEETADLVAEVKHERKDAVAKTKKGQALKTS